MDKLGAMRAFDRVARRGSFSAAAGDLGISKAMVSRHIANLENELGVQLFNRTTRRLHLTEVGSAYLERVRAILEEIDEAEEAVTQLNAEPRGTLRLVAPTNFGAFHLGRAIAGYMERYPEVQVDLSLNDRPFDLIEEGVDMAIRVGRLTDTSLIARQFATTRMVVCGSPEYLARHGVPMQPEELADHNCLIFTPSLPRSEWRFQGPEGPRNQRVSGSMVSDAGDPLRIAAIKGLGLIQQPEYMVWQDLSLGRLRTVLDDFAPPPRAINAIYPHRRHLSAKVRTLVSFLGDYFAPPVYWEKWREEGADTDG